MNQPIRHIAVLIPARNEEVLLPRCLRSVQVARLQLPPEVTSDVIVVCDCSQDRTGEIAEEILGDSGVVIYTDAGVVGAVRALAAQTALQRFSGLRKHCWLANTDADCEVPLNWLVDQIAIGRRGFTAVAGIVEVDTFAEHSLHVRKRFLANYLIHADGTHPHVHGANLGVRADVYLAAGGWADLRTSEDHDLWNRLRNRGHAHISDASLQVITSGRRSGRAPFGFADALIAHGESAA